MSHQILKVAMLQILPSTNDSQENNLRKGIDYCKKAALMNADIALFPEIWNCGYNLSGTAEQIKSRAISSDSDFVQTFANLAKELNMAIGITFLEKHEPLPKNTLCLFDRHGNKVLTYSKVHTCQMRSCPPPCRPCPGPCPPFPPAAGIEARL